MNDPNDPKDPNESNELNYLNDRMTESFADDWPYGIYSIITAWRPGECVQQGPGLQSQTRREREEDAGELVAGQQPGALGQVGPAQVPVRHAGHGLQGVGRGEVGVQRVELQTKVHTKVCNHGEGPY